MAARARVAMSLKLDRGAPVPLWRQVYGTLQEQILERTLPPGHRVPSEFELVRLTGASRATIRKALELLERERLIYRAGTKGAFVSERQVEQSLSILHGLSEKLEKLGIRVTSQVLGCRRRQPDPETQRLLELHAGEEVYVIERIRLANGVPLAIQVAYMPATIYPRLEEHDLTGSLTKLVRSEYGLDLASYNGTLEVISANDQQAKYLKVPAASPLLLFDGVTYNLAGVAVRRTLSVYRCDRLRFTVEGFGVETRSEAFGTTGGTCT